MSRAPRIRPNTTLGAYEVLDELSSGGMGEVLLARKRAAGGFERFVAIKTIRSDLRSLDQLRAMFLDEARLMSRLTHPAVAQVHDFGEQDGMLYLVMEYVAGISFGDLADMRVPPGIACRAMAQACRGLHAAHELKDVHGVSLGVVHRDVSPDNLMLTYDGSVSVLDFGIALMRGRHAPVTDFGTVKGKPPYLSPELVRGDSVDRRSDVFSAGSVLWEMLTGKPLFSGTSIYEAGLAVLDKDIPPLSSVVDDIPSDLDQVLATCLQRDPELRFQTTLAMAEALDQVASSMGTESLASYAARELGEAKEEHRQWISQLKSGEESKPIGRDTGIMTARAIPLPDSQIDASLVDSAFSGDNERTADAAASAPEEAAVPSSRKVDEDLDRVPMRARWPVLAALVLLTAGAVLGWRLLSSPGASSAPDASVTAMAATDAMLVPADASRQPADASAIAQTADAAPVPADASPGPDARRRPPRKPAHSGTSRDRRAKLDAGTRPNPPVDVKPEAVGTGFVTFVADPYASVRIDGQAIGNTPIFSKAVPAGTHIITLVSPDNGKVRLRKELTVKADKRYRIKAP